MFQDASNFNQNLFSWDVSNVIIIVCLKMQVILMRIFQCGMFLTWLPYNGTYLIMQQVSINISTWDVASVENMSYMFKDANNFNGDISIGMSLM